MLRDTVTRIYMEENRNCAESTLMGICEQYGLELSPEEIKVIGGFGGGMSCGRTCGALCGAIGALGKMLIQTKAHETEDLRATCGEMVELFVKKLGTTECKELRERLANPQRRCSATVELACDAFEELLAKKEKERKGLFFPP